MIYRNRCIKKKYVNLKNIQLDFSQNGIYFIKGNNGCGKTTVMETMLFDEDKEHYIFEQENEQETFNRDRNNIFSYVAQNIIYSELKVGAYVSKMNSAIKQEEIYKYLNAFDLPTNILNEKFYLLSGGEQMKISIITALLKNTPYVFMDEPSNYLDDGSVCALLDILKDEAKTKKIIIVSHDPRMNVSHCKEYVFDHETIILKDEGARKEEAADACIAARIPGNSKPSNIKLFYGMNKRYSFLVTFYIIMIFLAGVMLYTNLVFRDSLGESNDIYKDSIFAYYVGGGHDELNETYEKAEKIKVDEKMYDIYIDYESIPDIAKINGINEIYMPDKVYTNEIVDKLEGNETGNEILLYACPSKYYNQYSDIFTDELMIKYTEGNLPKDGKQEVAISKSILISKYGYTKSNVDKAIGDKIIINKKEYEIVGFSYLDLAIVSFQKETNYGFYCYNKDDYDVFKQKQMDYIKKIDGEDAVNDILIDLEEDDDKEVLNYLIKNYPSDCYMSDYFQTVFYKQQKTEVFIKWLFFHILISSIFAIIVWLIVRKAIQYNMHMVMDIGNYYINRKKIMKQYILIQCMQYIFVGAACMGCNIFLSKYSSLTNVYIIIDCLIIIIPVFISCFRGLKEVEQ